MTRIYTEDELAGVDLASFESFVLVAEDNHAEGNEIVSARSVSQAIPVPSNQAGAVAERRLLIEVKDPFDAAIVERVRDVINLQLLA